MRKQLEAEVVEIIIYTSDGADDLQEEEARAKRGQDLVGELRGFTDKVHALSKLLAALMPPSASTTPGSSDGSGDRFNVQTQYKACRDAGLDLAPCVLVRLLKAYAAALLERISLADFVKCMRCDASVKATDEVSINMIAADTRSDTEQADPRTCCALLASERLCSPQAV